jgi:MoaA/NifB/PqqE/SkfB family radical SAM enzyme
MSLRSKITGYLDRFEGGRAFKARVGVAARETAPQGGRIHPRLAGISHIYVEASFLCNLECRMCPRLLEGHKEGLMPVERFQRLVPLMRHLDAVILTGYGEPLLHPHLDEFVAIVRSCGSSPRLSTNGTILSSEKALKLLDAGLDNLQVSIDAGTKETFEQIRVGANWERVLRNSENFHRLLRGRGHAVGTGWVFVVMRSNYRELPAAVQHAAECGFPLFVAKFIERNALEYENEQNIHGPDGSLLADPAEFEAILGECRAVAERNAMEFRLHPFHLGETGACLADPLRSFFLDWMGNISPCCHLPVRSEQGHHPLHSFGNIDDDDVMEILLSPHAQRFFDNWRNKRIPFVCRRCYQVTRLPNREEYTHGNDWPEEMAGKPRSG